MKVTDPFLDKFGFVLPQPKCEDKPCDNGILFTSVAVALEFDVPNYEELIKSCYLKKGLVARWPGNNFDQQQWDDYMAIAVACILRKNVEIPRDILRYGITHAFFFDTDGKLEGRDFLLRNFPIWPLMISAALPIAKYLMYPFLWLVQKFFKDPKQLILDNDTSGFQLQWLFLYGCALLGFNFKSFLPHIIHRKEAFLIYYHKDHPFHNM